MNRKKYSNLDHKDALASFKDLRQWQKERRAKNKDFSFQVPVTTHPEIGFLATNRSIPTITWIGHSTFLIQINGKNILTDPVWARRLSFYKRLSPPGLALKELPPIDYVLISHSHYDHLHLPTIKKLVGNPTFLVPAGLGKWFLRKGFKETVEFHWWGTLETAGLKIAFVPAQHWTRRTLTDTNRSHWGGWVVESTGHPTIYFAGDSGYFQGFKQIGEAYDIDYSLMPIGAYEPEWFMAAQHVTPEEAIQAFVDSKGKQMIPMHYGAFYLADDTPKEALDRLYAGWTKKKLPENQLLVPKLGETIRLAAKSSTIL